MEPMLPPEGDAALETLAFDLAAKAGGLAGRLHPIVSAEIADLVRAMNCYYSNLIEGHDTHPRDIERALRRDFSDRPGQRDLQLEAVAHVEVQRMVDRGEGPAVGPHTRAYLAWLHGEFTRRLPDELRWAKDPDTGERLRVEPGALRADWVSVGRHMPPAPEHLPRFLDRFEEAYRPDRLSKVRRLAAAAAAHHRLLWIHPFLDGNGRVARLAAHAALRDLGLGDGLWSVARGLARRVDRYKALLAAADAPRRGDLDGRGALSQAALVEFCAFFLETCVDQVAFMERLIEPAEVLRRVEVYVAEEVAAKRLLPGSFPILREAFLGGEVQRGRADDLTGYRERQARSVVRVLLDAGLLRSEGPRAPLRLAFPVAVAGRWFPLLFPAT